MAGEHARESDHNKYEAASLTLAPTECDARRRSKVNAYHQRSLRWCQLTLRTHLTVSPIASFPTRPLLASSAKARQTPCHLDSPLIDSDPPNPMAPPALLPPGSATVPNGVSITGSSSVPAKRSSVAVTIWSRKSNGSVAVILARYLAAEYRTMVSYLASAIHSGLVTMFSLYHRDHSSDPLRTPLFLPELLGRLPRSAMSSMI